MLEYIHENEYVHADIKAANLMLGHRDPEQVRALYLLRAIHVLCFHLCPDVLNSGFMLLFVEDNTGWLYYPGFVCDCYVLGSCGLLQVYLADYGLSYRYCPDRVHKEYKENPKKGHNGTIEYTSLDAHKGVGKPSVSLTDV